MANIAEIVSELRGELESGETAASSVKFLCEEYGVKAELLNRLFEKSYGVSPEAYVPEKDRMTEAQIAQQELTILLHTKKLRGTQREMGLLADKANELARRAGKPATFYIR